MGFIRHKGTESFQQYLPNSTLFVQLQAVLLNQVFPSVPCPYILANYVDLHSNTLSSQKAVFQNTMISSTETWSLLRCVIL